MARLNKQSLVDDLSLHRAFESTPKSQVAEVVDYIFELITDHVANGDDVTIAGFGKFQKTERTKNGEPIGSFRPKLVTYKAFKDAVSAA